MARYIDLLLYLSGVCVRGGLVALTLTLALYAAGVAVQVQQQGYVLACAGETCLWVSPGIIELDFPTDRACRLFRARPC